MGKKVLNKFKTIAEKVERNTVIKLGLNNEGGDGTGRVQCVCTQCGNYR